MTAVTRDAEAILHALIMISSSMRLSLISPQPLCTMNTSSPRTDSLISTLQRTARSRDLDRCTRSPRLAIAELLGDHSARLEAESRADELRQLGMRRTTEHFDIRHSGTQQRLCGYLFLLLLMYGLTRVATRSCFQTHSITISDLVVI